MSRMISRRVANINASDVDHSIQNNYGQLRHEDPPIDSSMLEYGDAVVKPDQMRAFHQSTVQ